MFALAALLAVCVPGVARGAITEVRINSGAGGGQEIKLTEQSPYYKNGGGAADVSNYNVYLNAAAGELTLRNLDLEYTGTAGIFIHRSLNSGPLMIILEGDNQIVSKATGTANRDIGIEYTGGNTTTFKGAGSLTIEAGAGTTGLRYGIDCDNLVIESGVIRATGGVRGVHVGHDFRMENGVVHATGGTEGVWIANIPIINGGQLTGVGTTQGIRNIRTEASNMVLWVGANETDAFSRDGQIPNRDALKNMPYATVREAYKLTLTGGIASGGRQYLFAGTNETVTAGEPSLFTRWEVVQAPAGFAIDLAASSNSFAMPTGNVTLLAHHDPGSITLDKPTLSLLPNATDTLTPIYQPSYADKGVTWQSSDPNVATVDANGNVTAVALGTATITATSTVKTTVSATSNVTVTNPPSPPPQTGDPAKPALWAMLGSISLACAAMFLHRMRKRA